MTLKDLLSVSAPDLEIRNAITGKLMAAPSAPKSYKVTALYIRGNNLEVWVEEK